ncbi:hypothetical protein [Acaryochloris sp. IP29b_bin.148]|uniref:hypothetical protein n=1 Tax=Acaryochloris sp. IP29b_bin.148 TaxID=2969218 RepID=UPI0026045666|nr:hypothetical protein [Acaryochloris sp. IP29b_bin.148]
MIPARHIETRRGRWVQLSGEALPGFEKDVNSRAMRPGSVIQIKLMYFNDLTALTIEDLKSKNTSLFISAFLSQIKNSFPENPFS